MMPMPGRWLSCALMRCGSSLTLVDCGEGTQVPWKSLGWGFRQLGAICFTHMHADHVAGLPGVLFMVAHAGRTEPLDIYGPAGTSYVIEGLRRIVPELPFPVQVHELKSGEHFPLPGGLRGSCAAAAHGIPCLAYRFELESFFAALLEGRKPSPGPEDALETLRLALAAKKSWRENRPVKVSEILG